MAFSRLSALDGLRGYAAFIVVFFHSILEVKPALIEDVLKKPIYALNNSYDLLTKIVLIVFNGHAAVALFFVLSGAVLIRALQKNTAPLIPLFLKFLTQRIFRIYPALIVCLISIYGLSSALHLTCPAWFQEHFSLYQFWQNCFLLGTKLHGASWTLQVEMMAVPFVVLAFFLLKKDRYFWIFLFLTGCYGAVFAVYWPIGLTCFALGFLLVSPKMGRFFSTLPPIFSVFFLILTLAVKHVFPEAETLLIKGIRWGLQGLFVFGLVGFVYHNTRGLVVKWLNHPISQYLGRLSYSLYLFNVLGLHAFVVVTQHYFPKQCAQDPLMVGLCLGAVLSLVTLPIAHLSYEYVEKSGIKLGQWVVQRLSGLPSLMRAFKPHMTSN